MDKDLLQEYKNDLAVMKKWLEEKPMEYIKLPNEVKQILSVGQVETRLRVKAISNDFL